jgi:hypothetical protein
MIFRLFSLFFIVIFALIGLFFSTTVIHEYSHAADYGVFLNENHTGKICLFPIENITWKSKMGYFEHTYTQSTQVNMTAIGKYTEYKAYGLSLPLLIIGTIIITTFLFKETNRSFQ